MVNQDYTNSAIDLCNPQEVKELLDQYHEEIDKQGALQAQADAMIPQELRDSIAEKQELVSELNQQICDAIEKYGSFQDVEAGHYAVKQKKVSQVFHVGPFKEHYAEFVPAVIVETVDKKKVTALIKGGLIEEADLKGYKVITEDVTYAFIVR